MWPRCAAWGSPLLPHCLVATNLQAGQLEAVLADAVQVRLSLLGVYASRRQHSAKARCLIDFLADDPRMR